MSYRDINIKALALGALTDLGGSLIAALAYGFVVGFVLGAQGVRQHELGARFASATFLAPGLMIGFAFTLLGGYVAGRVSKTSEVIHGGLVGLISLLFGLIYGLFLSRSVPMWYTVLSFVGVIPFGMLGGWAAATKRRESDTDPVTDRAFPMPNVATCPGCARYLRVPESEAGKEITVHPTLQWVKKR